LAGNGKLSLLLGYHFDRIKLFRNKEDGIEIKTDKKIKRSRVENVNFYFSQVGVEPANFLLEQKINLIFIVIL